jgi:hypothetical protein
LHEDGLERGNGPEIADYGGFALNDAGRLFALSYDPSRLTLRHHQCDAYVMPYQMRAVGNFRTWEERDPHNQQLIALHWWAQTTEGNRTIWMDGRPHPPEAAAHTWMGFSTGKWDGNILTVYTTHIKQGWIRRNGVPESDQATLVEHFIRHGDHMTHVSIVTDPVYLTEPLIKSQDFNVQTQEGQNWLYPCEYVEEVAGRARGATPSYMPGQNPFLHEFADRYKIPMEAALGGAETMYPEYQQKLKMAAKK